MTTYICLLRGINVSGHKLIKMKELQQMFVSIGMSEVTTYIQSGNIVFKTNQGNIVQLTADIRNGILSTFGFDVYTLLIEAKELLRLFKANPFVTNTSFEIEKMLLTLLSEEPAKDKCDAFAVGNYGQDKYIIQDKALYLYCEDGYGKTKLSNNFIESKLKINATTRNWKTITELLKISKVLE